MIFIRAKPKVIQDKPYKPDYVRYDKPVPITENHKLYHRYLKDKKMRIVLCDGYAGTSKSICAMYYSAQAILDGSIKGVCVIRPNEGIGKDIGYLPGTELEKLSPKLKQLLTYLESFLNMDIRYMIEKEIVILQSLFNLQGMDLTGYNLIVDECQLIGAKEMYCICTRGAEKVVITGDTNPAQAVNIKIKKHKDGLSFLISTLNDLPYVGIVKMDKIEDIVRQGYIKDVIIRMTQKLDEWENE